MTQKTLVNRFVISTFVLLYLCVSVISTIHVIDFFSMSNPYWLAVSLAIAFELGAAASLASLIALDKMNKGLVWALFITITAMQMQGNMYYAFKNLQDYTSWVELFNLVEEDPLYQKRILSFVSGAILPLVALGFIKSLVDYIKPTPEEGIKPEMSLEEKVEGMRKIVQSYDDLSEEMDREIERLDELSTILEESPERPIVAANCIEETVVPVETENDGQIGFEYDTAKEEDSAESILGLTVEEVETPSIEKYARVIKNADDLNEYLEDREKARGLTDKTPEKRNVKGNYGGGFWSGVKSE